MRIYTSLLHRWNVKRKQNFVNNNSTTFMLKEDPNVCTIHIKWNEMNERVGIKIGGNHMFMLCPYFSVLTNFEGTFVFFFFFRIYNCDELEINC